MKKKTGIGLAAAACVLAGIVAGGLIIPTPTPRHTLAQSNFSGGGGSGSGTVANCATTNALAIYTAATTTGCGNADFTYATDTLTMGASGILDTHAGVAGSLLVPSPAGACSSTTGAVCMDTAIGAFGVGTGAGTFYMPHVASSGQTNTNCNTTFQYLTAVDATAVPTCRPLNASNTSQKNETASADASLYTITPVAAAGEYLINCNASVSAATSGVIAFTVSWTDSNGTAQSNLQILLYQPLASATAAPAPSITTSAAGNFTCVPTTIDVNNAAAAITVKWVGGGTTTAKVSASAVRVI